MRRLAAVLTAVLMTALTTVPLAGPTAAASPASSTLPLTVSVMSMTPWTPASRTSEQPLSITVSLRNTTGSDIDHVTLEAGRGNNPVTSQSALDTSLADRTLPDGLQPIPAHPAVRTGIDVPAGGAPVTATFRTTSTTSTPCRLCLYANGVYPVYLSAVDSRTGALRGYTRTYLASRDGTTDVADHRPGKADVAWVWPLIDAPHRLAEGRVFTDRLLPRELLPDGRLNRALQVAEDVGSEHPSMLTLVLDPELIDELEILSSGNYSYQSGSGKAVAGAKVAAAGTWLTRLRALLPEVRVEFTPYADPDIQSLSSSDLSWHSTMPPTMLGRVQQALGLTTLPSRLSWPPGGAVSERTLTRIAADGATSVLLDDTSVRPTNVGGLPASTATLHTPRGALSAALTSPALQDDVAASIRHDDRADLSHLPSLLAEIAVRADTVPFGTRAVFLAAPRYVDPDVAAAETVIDETMSSTFSTPASLSTALAAGAASGSGHARTRHLSGSAPGLSTDLLGNAQQISQALPAATALLTGPHQSPEAEPLLTDLGRGVQRVESAAYLSSSTLSDPATGVRQAERLRRQVTGLLGAVHIVRPEPPRRTFSYTLASANSPLPITVENSSSYRAFVHISVRTAGGLLGLTTTDLGAQSIAPESKQTFRIPAHVGRSGRIALVATLTTAHGEHALGPPVRLTVHSTVLGTIGIVITVVAAIVLFLALAVRYIRRLQRLRRKRRASSDDGRVPARIG